MSATLAVAEPVYGERVLTVEPYSIERIPRTERHGRPFGLFVLWLGANLTIADFAIGFLPTQLGLSWTSTLLALLIGNVLGGALLALASTMGPRTGYPQMIAGRWAFGRIGSYLPATLNWVSTVGWFTVNNVLGSFGLQVLFPGLPFPVAAALLVVVQVLLAVFGHNLIHAYERVMAVVLGVLFLIMTVRALTHWSTLTAYHGSGFSLAGFAIVLAAAFSYIASWAPYASDYSRYLPEDTSAPAAFLWTFLGSVVASLWLEVVGVLVAVLAGAAAGNPIAAAHSVMGSFGTLAVLALILGVTAADALNLYSNALSARALDLRLSRPILTLAAGGLGLVLSVAGSGHFYSNYEDFLLLLGYWITPWLAVLFIDFFFLPNDWRVAPGGVRWAGLVSYLIGIAVSVPFMSSPLFTGPIAARIGDADFSYYIGFLVAGLVFWVWTRAGRARVTQEEAGLGSRSAS